MRGSVLKSRLAQRGVKFPALDANQHFDEYFLHIFRVKKRIMLSNADLTSRVRQDVVLRAFREVDMATEEEKKLGNETYRCPDWSGRGNGGGQNGRREGQGGC